MRSVVILIFALLLLPGCRSSDADRDHAPAMQTLIVHPEDSEPIEGDSLATPVQIALGGIVASSAVHQKASAAANSDLRACGMVWHRDERRPNGVYSIWRPTRPVAVRVNHVRGGRIVSAITLNARPPNQEIGFLTDPSGQNYDGVQYCIATL